ncbi:MoxR family ATPase [Xylanibacillus composti]|nr:MoxR family ATPase [Xylanibacillus composti]
MRLEEMTQIVQRIRSNVNAVMVGKEAVTDYLMIALVAGGHVLLDDVPGTGKTMTAKTFAASLGCSVKRVQFTADLLPSDITGINVFNQQKSEFELRKGPVFANILLADEINRATPRTQSSLLEAMEERQVTIDGDTYKLPLPFLVMATQNPLDQQGTFPLPEAQLDRFLLKIPSGYPNLEQEDTMLQRFASDDPLAAVRAVTTPDELEAMQLLLKEVHVSAAIRQYLLAIMDKTRQHPDLAYGVSPRGSLQLYQAARARALIAGRNYVEPDDVKALIGPVCAHRLSMGDGLSDFSAVQQVLEEIVRQVPVPTELAQHESR